MSSRSWSYLNIPFKIKFSVPKSHFYALWFRTILQIYSISIQKYKQTWKILSLSRVVPKKPRLILIFQCKRRASLSTGRVWQQTWFIFGIKMCVHISAIICIIQFFQKRSRTKVINFKAHQHWQFLRNLSRAITRELPIRPYSKLIFLNSTTKNL